jgi:hypothetical protein
MCIVRNGRPSSSLTKSKGRLFNATGLYLIHQISVSDHPITVTSDGKEAAAGSIFRYQAFHSHDHSPALLPAQAIRSCPYEPVFHASAERIVELDGPPGAGHRRR